MLRGRPNANDEVRAEPSRCVYGSACLLALDLVQGVTPQAWALLLDARLQFGGDATLDVDGRPVVQLTGLRALQPDVFSSGLLLRHCA